MWYTPQFLFVRILFCKKSHTSDTRKCRQQNEESRASLMLDSARLFQKSRTLALTHSSPNRYISSSRDFSSSLSRSKLERTERTPFPIIEFSEFGGPFSFWPMPFFPFHSSTSWWITMPTSGTKQAHAAHAHNLALPSLSSMPFYYWPKPRSTSTNQLHSTTPNSLHSPQACSNGCCDLGCVHGK